MKRQEILIRKSPFVFLKRVALLIFLFALLPTAAVLLADFRNEYQASQLADFVPDYTMFVVVLTALLEFGLVVVAFTSWYFAAYAVDSQQIVYRRSGLQGDKKLVDTAKVAEIAAHQGPLGRRLDYGDLVLSSAAGAVLATLKDVPNPAHHAEQIEKMAEQARVRLGAPERQPAAALIGLGEGQFVEFKASLMWDYYRQSANKDLYEPVMKNVAAFMNTAGGTLLVGVGDEGEVLGLEKDFSVLPKKNADGWENAFNMAFNSMIGAEFRQFVDLGFEQIDGTTVCVLAVQPAVTPVYLTFKGKEDFYIRTGNSSQPLPVSKAARYIQTHFLNA